MRSFFNPWTIGLLVIMAFFSLRSGTFDHPIDWLMSIVMMLPGIVRAFFS